MKKLFRKYAWFTTIVTAITYIYKLFSRNTVVDGDTIEVDGNTFTLKRLDGADGLKFLYAATDGTNIYADALFAKLSPKMKECVILHELGHQRIKGGMPDDVATAQMVNIARSFGISNSYEFKADSYVVMKKGKLACLGMLSVMFIHNPIEIAMRMIAVLTGYKSELK